MFLIVNIRKNQLMYDVIVFTVQVILGVRVNCWINVC